MKKLRVYVFVVFTLTILLGTVALYKVPDKEPQQFSVYHERDAITIETKSYKVGIDKERVKFNGTYDGILVVDHAYWVIYDKQGFEFRSDFAEERGFYDKTKNEIPIVEGYCVPKTRDGTSSNVTVRFELECYDEILKLTTWFMHNPESQTIKFQSLNLKLFLNKELFTNFWFSELNNGNLTQSGLFYSEAPQWPLRRGLYGCYGKNNSIWIIPPASPLFYKGYGLGAASVGLVRGVSIEDWKDKPVIWFSYLMTPQDFEVEVKGGETLVNGYEMWIYLSREDVQNAIRVKKVVNTHKILIWVIKLSILGLGAAGVMGILEVRLKRKNDISLSITLSLLFILPLFVLLCLTLRIDTMWAELRGWVILFIITLTVGFSLADLMKPAFIKKETLFLLSYGILCVFSTCLALIFLGIML